MSEIFGFENRLHRERERKRAEELEARGWLLVLKCRDAKIIIIIKCKNKKEEKSMTFKNVSGKCKIKQNRRGGGW